MRLSEFQKYQAESVMRAKQPPVAKHSQNKQPQKEAA